MLYVLCRVTETLCALPVACVRMTMRPLPLEHAASASEAVLGVARIGGAFVPVIDLAQLVTGKRASDPKRFALLQVGERSVAAAVDAVLQVMDLPPETISAMPPLLTRTNQHIEGMAQLDGRLLAVLSSVLLMNDLDLPDPGVVAA